MSMRKKNYLTFRSSISTWRRFRLVFLLTILVSGFGLTLWPSAPSVHAQTPIFRWVDKKGDMHITDRLGDVPEPYRSLYAAKIRELEEKKESAPNVTLPTDSQKKKKPKAALRAPAPSGQSFVDKKIARQKYWMNLVAKSRAQLDRATQNFVKISQELDNKRLNPILREIPANKAAIKKLEEAREKARADLENARYQLLEAIPLRAKKEMIPHKWLL